MRTEIMRRSCDRCRTTVDSEDAAAFDGWGQMLLGAARDWDEDAARFDQCSGHDLCAECLQELKNWIHGERP